MSSSSASENRSRTCMRAAEASKPAAPATSSSSSATVCKGRSVVCDSQNVANTSAPASLACDVSSRTTRLLPIPGGPTSPDDAAVAVDRPLEDTGERAHLPLPADETSAPL